MVRSPTRHPFPSTTELVAKVEDRETRTTFFSILLSRPDTDSFIPLDRSSRVVRALERQTVIPLSMSRMTESV